MRNDPENHGRKLIQPEIEVGPTELQQAVNALFRAWYENSEVVGLTGEFRDGTFEETSRFDAHAQSIIDSEDQ